MTNYKSKMLTFLTVGEMTGFALNSTDEDGILFAVATDAINFKIVMWRKGSFATVDNEWVYPANGPGRWHVLSTGSREQPAIIKEVLAGVGDDLNDDITADTEVILQKKTSGEKIIRGRFNGIYEDISSSIIQFNNSILPPTPDPGKSICVLSKTGPDRTLTYSWKNNQWVLINYTNMVGEGSPLVNGDCPGQMYINLLSDPISVYVWDSNAWR